MATQNELRWLIVRNRTGRCVVAVLRLLVSDADMELMEPALQRLMRGPNNEGLSFEVKERIPD